MKSHSTEHRAENKLKYLQIYLEAKQDKPTACGVMGSGRRFEEEGSVLNLLPMLCGALG